MSRFIIASGLLAACVLIHAFCLMAVYRWASHCPALHSRHFWPGSWLLIRIAWWTVLTHLVEISLWAWFYVWQEVFDSFATAFYFSIVTYTTVGYGDVVAPEGWRSFGAVEGLVGILMCGWSTAFFFAVVSRMYTHAKDKDAAPR